MDDKMLGKISSYVFIGGIIIALLVGLAEAYDHTLSTYGWIGWILAIIGAIVGILAFFGKGTITEKEVPTFLLAGIALVVMYGVFNGMGDMLKPYLGALLQGVSMSLAIFVAPAVGLLSIKAIWDIGKSV